VPSCCRTSTFLKLRIPLHISENAGEAGSSQESIMHQVSEPEPTGLNLESMAAIVSQLLTDIVARNDELLNQLPDMSREVTPFHSSAQPVSVKSYLEDRILKYAGISEETIILALIYIDQVVLYNKNFFISSLNVHRLLITSTSLASFSTIL